MKRIGLILIVIALCVFCVSFSAAAAEDAEPLFGQASGQIPEQDPGEEDRADCPALVSVVPTQGGMTVRWDAYPGAAAYRVFLREGDAWRALADTADTAYLHIGLSNNTAYRYAVQALDAAGDPCSEIDSMGVTVVYHSTPVLSRVTNELGGQRVSWTAVDGAESYKVYQKTADGWRSVGITTTPSFLNTDAVSGVTYTYTVRCCSADGGQLQSYFDRSGIALRYVAAPKLTDCTPVSGGLRLTWSASSGADKYRLFIKRADGSGWTRVGETSGTVCTHSGLGSGTTYTYTVRAYNASGEAVSSFDPVGLTATYRDAPRMGKAANVYGGQKVSWTAVDGAEAYQVYVKTDSVWRVIGTATEPVFVWEDVLPGVAYTYTVRCCTADGEQPQSAYDTKGVSATYYPAPEVVGFTATDGGCEIAWTAVDGAARYRLYHMTDAGWKGVATTADTFVIHQDLTDRVVYAYTVRALNAAGDFITGYHPDGWQHTYYAPPAVTGVDYNDGAYTVCWDGVDGIGGYALYRKALGGVWEPVYTTDDTAATAYRDAAIEPQTPYTYTLQLLGTGGEPISAYLTDTLYYLDGALAEGELCWGDNTLHFENGHIRQGYVTIDGRLYYYSSEGVLMKNAIVGSAEEGYTAADENGVCCISEEIRLAAKFMMEHATGDTLDERMKTGYLYLAHQFPYNRTYDHPSKAEDIPALAIDMFTNEKGNCYRYAACFACLAKIAGYRARVVLGTTGGNPHGWVEVLVDGEWLICDPDADIPKYGNPDYTAYMMKEHYWQLTPKTRCELIIDENGVASWV